MTSKLTREENVQAVFDLKAGYTLGLADVEILKRVARMALAAMDSKPVAWTEKCEITNMQATGLYLRGFPDNSHGRDIPLYRHAQQPVVPDDLLDALQKVARIRLDLNDFDGDRRGIADCLSDAEEELIEVVNRCAAMLAAAPQEVPDGK